MLRASVRDRFHNLKWLYLYSMSIISMHHHHPANNDPVQTSITRHRYATAAESSCCGELGGNCAHAGLQGMYRTDFFEKYISIPLLYR